MTFTQGVSCGSSLHQCPRLKELRRHLTFAFRNGQPHGSLAAPSCVGQCELKARFKEDAHGGKGSGKPTAGEDKLPSEATGLGGESSVCAHARAPLPSAVGGAGPLPLELPAPAETTEEVPWG